jgi:hydroxymethylpyrimidine pyrophosphatase-like HAD family hydrolase
MDDLLYLTSFKVSGRASIDEFAVCAIATDLDGTLLRSDGTVSPRSIESLRAAEAVGILVMIATARPPRRVVPLIEAPDFCGIAVCANGALVYDTSEHRTVASQAFPPGNTRAIVRRLREALHDKHGVAQVVESLLRNRHRERGAS